MNSLDSLRVKASVVAAAVRDDPPAGSHLAQMGTFKRTDTSGSLSGSSRGSSGQDGNQPGDGISAPGDGGI